MRLYKDHAKSMAKDTQNVYIARYIFISLIFRLALIFKDIEFRELLFNRLLY